MSGYTEFLNSKAETLSPEDDDYEESLLAISRVFRGFGEALTEFLEDHGYEGDPADAAQKAGFLREKFREAGIKPPRDLKDLFQPDKKISRKTAFQICFAFRLGAAETNEFFRCVQLERGFDCHTVSEVVYYFCRKHGLSYAEAEEILDRVPASPKIKALPRQDVLYTGTILESIERMDDREQLVQYLTENGADFQYSNATAIRYIRELWTKISGKKDGANLAAREGKILDDTYNLYQDRSKKGSADPRTEEEIRADVAREKQIKGDDRVIAGENASTWTIFAQILGLDNRANREYAAERSIASVLSKSALLPLNASYCFPSQHGIDRILRGEQGDNELMRKTLIFLTFYAYWAGITANKRSEFYRAERIDSERCLSTINGRLLDANYPELYAGNPYDWLFLWSLQDDYPLDAFRSCIGEIFAMAKETAEPEV